MVHVLLGLVGVMPDDFHLEAPTLVAFQPDDLDAGDAFERVQDGAFAKFDLRLCEEIVARICREWKVRFDKLGLHRE